MDMHQPNYFYFLERHNMMANIIGQLSEIHN
uniref:Uncharacterized protein n=1 Tax=Arundo donax TaxID=35708 RepID=A0A0A9DLU0_ARUDO